MPTLTMATNLCQNSTLSKGVLVIANHTEFLVGKAYDSPRNKQARSPEEPRLSLTKYPTPAAIRRNIRKNNTFPKETEIIGSRQRQRHRKVFLH